MQFRTLSLAFLLFVFSAFAWSQDQSNLLANPGFEGSRTTALAAMSGWEFSSWTEKSDKSYAVPDYRVFHSGASSLCINNIEADDAKLVQVVPVDPDSIYRVSAWMKTQGVSADKAGANISALDITETSDMVSGDTDWKQVTVYGRTGPKQKELQLSLRLGAYSNVNSGAVWFDDVQMEKVKDVPKGAKTINWYKQVDSSLSKYLASPEGSPLLFAVLWIWLLAFALVVWTQWNGGLQPKLRAADSTRRAWDLRLLIVLGTALGCKILISGAMVGYGIDMGTFAAWSRDAWARGLGGFYQEGYFADYPPGYIWLLWLIGGIQATFKLADWSFPHLALLKLPSILADLATVWLVWRLANKPANVDGTTNRPVGKRSGKQAGKPVADARSARTPATEGTPSGKALAWALAIFLLVQPLVTLESSVWGQVDSIFTLVLALALSLLESRKVIPAAALYGLAVLLKPQALLLAPLALIGIGKEFRHCKPLEALRLSLSSVAAFAGTALVVMLPFAWGKEPGWIFSLYTKTLGSYPYASLNAPNVWTLLGLNWAPLENNPATSWVGTVSWVLMGLVFLYVFVLAIRTSRSGAWFLAGFIMIAGFFVLGTKMHERYLYPALIFGLLAFVYLRDRRILVMTLLVGLTMAVNLYSVLIYKVSHDTTLVPVWDWGLLACSVLNVVVLGWAMIVAWQLLVQGRQAIPLGWKIPDSNEATGDDAELPESSKAAAKNGKAKSAKDARDALPSLIPDMDVPFRIQRRDWVIMGVISLVFAVLTFVNLGSATSPQKAWVPKRAGEAVVFDLGADKKITKIGYHWGLDTGDYRVDWSTDGQVWREGPVFNNTNRFVEMRWYYQSVDASARYGRIMSVSGKQELDEFALWSEAELLVPKILSGPAGAFDEQETATQVSDYLNGMYFDEVYHARAAWEYLHGRDSSENTHPPLGKLIIAIGVKAFGMNPWGFRFMGALFGVFMLPLMYLIGLRLFRETRWATLVCAFFALDFMHFAQTRIATIDTYGVFFILLSYYFMLAFMQGSILRSSWKSITGHLLAAGVAFGLGAASKWIVLYSAAGLALFWLVRVIKDLREPGMTSKGKKPAGIVSSPNNLPVLRNAPQALPRVILLSVLSFVVLPGLIYTASYLPMMDVTQQGVKAMVDNQSSMYNYHAKLQATHPYSSYWYEWPWMKKPIYYYSGGDVVSKDQISSIYGFGNPVTWILGSVAFLTMVWIILRDKYRSWKKLPLLENEAPVWKLGALFIVAGALVQYAPWAIIPRQLVFIYHFFATVPFLILALVWVLARRDRLRRLESARSVAKARTAATTYARIKTWSLEHEGAILLGLALVLFIYFYPVISGLPVSKVWYGFQKFLTGGWPY